MTKRFDLKDFKTEPLQNARFIQTLRAHYTQNGKERTWEVVQAHDSVAILLYHTAKNAFVLVRQFRPAVYMHNQEGTTVELCAGIVDKQLPLVQIAQEEIEEECGYRVPLASIKKVTAFYTSVGFAGSKQSLFYAQVDESQRLHEGGGVEDEEIEVVFLSVSEAKKFLYDESIAKTPGLMFAFMWWFENHSQ